MNEAQSRLLQLVERSPACVAAQDRDGWLALFTRDGVVEDPVGAAPNQRAALGPFYDTFIAGNEIRFDVIEDLFGAREVVRDVVIHTHLSTGLELQVPAYLIYEVADEDGALRIHRLRAVWDLRRRSIGALTAGPRGLVTLGVISMRMLKNQGLAATLGYSRGLTRGIFGRGEQILGRLADALARGDREAASLFTEDAVVDLPAGVREPARAWCERGEPLAFEVSRVISAGWITAFRFALLDQPGGGVAFLEFAPGTRAIAALRFFSRS